MNNKHSLNVRGPSSLLKAFSEELENLGYNRANHPVLNNYKSVVTYKDGIYTCLSEFNKDSGEPNAIIIDLPEAWQDAIMLAADEAKANDYIGKWMVETFTNMDNQRMIVHVEKVETTSAYNEPVIKQYSGVNRVGELKERHSIVGGGRRLSDFTDDKDIVLKVMKEFFEKKFSNTHYGIEGDSQQNTYRFNWDQILLDTDKILVKEANHWGHVTVFKSGKWTKFKPLLVFSKYPVRGFDSFIKVGCIRIDPDRLPGAKYVFDKMEEHGNLRILWQGVDVYDDIKKILDKYGTTVKSDDSEISEEDKDC